MQSWVKALFSSTPLQHEKGEHTAPCLPGLQDREQLCSHVHKPAKALMLLCLSGSRKQQILVKPEALRRTKVRTRPIAHDPWPHIGWSMKNCLFILDTEVFHHWTHSWNKTSLSHCMQLYLPYLRSVLSQMKREGSERILVPCERTKQFLGLLSSKPWDLAISKSELDLLGFKHCAWHRQKAIALSMNSGGYKVSNIAMVP